VADEIVRLLAGGSVRDKSTGLTRPMRPGDIAILFRSRTSHREFEQALAARGVPGYVYKGLGFFDADEIKDLTALLRYLAEPTSHLRAAAFLRSRFVRLSDAALAALAPDIASAPLADAPIPALDDEDRAALEHVRPCIRRWLAAVDRVTPAELLDQVLSETAYAYELRGARRKQAWENVKKMRGLLRRIQNRGYATLGRIANHLDALTAGDESNAVLEALDAVNLMTVHASKGLEFPIVFIVNLAKGASAPPRPIRVSAEGAGAGDEAASVSVGPFVSDTDELERARERHETRRLLYVAVTRARERLYFASALKEGRLVPGRGSLAEVLPESLKTLFGRAATTFPEMETLGWAGVSGREYAWHLCRRAGEVSPRGEEPGRWESALPGNFGPPVLPRGVRRLPVSGLSQQVGLAAADDDRGGHGDRLLGVLVHRLFEARPSRPVEEDLAKGKAFALRLLRPDELGSVQDPSLLAEHAAAAWLRARARPDLVELLGAARVLHEVPFSMPVVVDGRTEILRGTIDCLVLHDDGRATVVEIKTGRPREAHQRQLDAYVEAVRALRRAEVRTSGDAGDTPQAGDVTGVLVYV
jgi:ATP-dependent exoDNAse (exonuclease V) beta subunit